MITTAGTQRSYDQERQEMYAASALRHDAMSEATRRAEWISFHVLQAERLEETAAALAAGHRAKAARLREKASP
jgi:hypothetical protein